MSAGSGKAVSYTHLEAAEEIKKKFAEVGATVEIK